MTNLISLRWCGTKAAVEAALAALGDPRFVPMEEGPDGPIPTIPWDARVQAFGEVKTKTILGVEATFSLVLAKEPIALPEGLEEADEEVSRATVGDFMPDPPVIVATLAFWNRLPLEKQVALATSGDLMMRTLMATLGMAVEVDLRDPVLRNGIGHALTLGLITQEEHDRALALG